MKAVFEKYNMSVGDEELAFLVDDTRSTTLYDLSEFARQYGLKSKAVKISPDKLANIERCQAILFLPDKNHYVLLGDMDEKFVRLIDLTSRKFYYRIKRSVFDAEHPEIIALLIGPDEIEVNAKIINSVMQRDIIGKTSCPFGCFSCTDLIQSFNIVFCPDMAGGTCFGQYETHYERYGPAPSVSGSVFGGGLIGSLSTDCIVNAHIPDQCTITGEWVEHYLRACN